MLHFGDNSLFQNAVGYQKVALTQGGAKMIGAPFTAIGEKGNGFWLSDLKPDGYLDNIDLKENGINGDFSIQILDTAGLPAAIYSWVHEVKKGEFKGEGYWTDPSFDPVEAKGENDYFFVAGSGLWTTAPDVSDEDQEAIYDVTPAGQVTKDSVVWHLPAGAAAYANPYPIAFHITDLIPEGYLDNIDLKENGINGDFSIQVLDGSGLPAAIYSWVHEVKKGEFKGDGYWTDPSFEPIEAGTENDLEITSSMGLWITAPDRSDEDPEADYLINVNYPVAD